MDNVLEQVWKTRLNHTNNRKHTQNKSGSLQYTLKEGRNISN